MHLQPAAGAVLPLVFLVEIILVLCVLISPLLRRAVGLRWPRNCLQLLRLTVGVMSLQLGTSFQSLLCMALSDKTRLLSLSLTSPLDLFGLTVRLIH